MDPDVRVLFVGQTGVGIVPCNEGNNDTKDTAGDCGAVGLAQLANAE